MSDTYSDDTLWAVCEKYSSESLQESHFSNGDPTDVVTFVTPQYSADPDEGQRDKWRMYRPLEDAPDLFYRFARIHSTASSEIFAKQMLRWVHRYGLLGDYAGAEDPDVLRMNEIYGAAAHYPQDEARWVEWEEPTRLAYLQNEVVRAASVLALYEAVLEKNSEKARQLILEGTSVLALRYKELRGKEVVFSQAFRERYYAPLQRKLRPSEIAAISQYVDEEFDGDYLSCALHVSTWVVEVMVRLFCYPTIGLKKAARNPSDLILGWGFKNLLGAMYLQMYSLVEAGGPVTYCKQCDLLIPLAPPYPGAKSRPKHKEFCDGTCRQRYRRGKGGAPKSWNGAPELTPKLTPTHAIPGSIQRTHSP